MANMGGGGKQYLYIIARIEEKGRVVEDMYYNK